MIAATKRPPPGPHAAAAPLPRGGSWLAAQGRLPLAFMALALAWLAGASVATALAPDLLTLPHTAPAVVALTHAWALGFFVTIAAGAMYQLAPVALSATLASERSGWVHLALHGLAVPVMVYAFWRWNLGLLGAAGGFVFIGLVVFATNILRTIQASGKRDAVAWALALATGWLLLTAAAGLTLVANRLWNFWPVDPLPLLRAHAHLGLVGFFLTLFQGVTFRLIPMFTLGEVPDWRPVRIGLWLSQAGLLGLAPALAWHAGSTAAVCGAMITVGMLVSGWALKLTLATRKKRRLDPTVRAFLRGTAVLILAGGTGIWLVWPKSPFGSAPGGFNATAYGVLIFFGGLLPAIAGMMGKIVPFLTWMRAYGPKVGRGATPPATVLSHPRLESLALAVQGFAAMPLLAGTIWLNLPLLRLGGMLLALGTGLFLANMIRIFRHLWRPVTVAPLARPSASS